MFRRRASAAALALLAAASPAHGDGPAAVRHLRTDLAALLRPQRPVPRGVMLAGAAFLAAVAAADGGLAATARHRLPDELRLVEPGGRVAAANAVGGALLLAGLAGGGERLRRGGLALLEGNLLLGVTLDLAKTALGRARPLEPHHGQLFRGGESFPSSHAAHAFLVAAVVDATAGSRAVRRTVYPLAVLVALSRLQNGAHHPTDVLAGAALGWWIGNRLAAAHRVGREGTPVRLTAVPLPGGAGLAVACRF